MIDTETHSNCPGHGIYLRVWGVKDADMQKSFVCTRPESRHSRYGHTLSRAERLAAGYPEAEAETEEIPATG